MTKLSNPSEFVNYSGSITGWWDSQGYCYSTGNQEVLTAMRYHSRKKRHQVSAWSGAFLFTQNRLPMSQFNPNGSTAQLKFDELIAGVESKINNDTNSPLLLTLLGALVDLRDNLPESKPKRIRPKSRRRPQLTAS